MSELTASIIHEAEYIDATPLGTRRRRDRTIRRMRGWAFEVAQLETQCEALADNCMRHGSEIHQLEAEVGRLETEIERLRGMVIRLVVDESPLTEDDIAWAKEQGALLESE